MKSLAEIEAITKDYSLARTDLSVLVTSLVDDIEALKRRAMPRLKARVAKAAEKQEALRAAIDESRNLFVKPRTIIMHGIKLGLEKGKGSIEIADDQRTIELIRKHLSEEQADLLIKEEPKLLKTALKNLSVADLKRIGCTVEETGDQIVIRPTDKEVDKTVNALLKDAVEVAETQAQEAA